MDKDTFVSYIIENFSLEYPGSRNMPPTLAVFKDALEEAWQSHTGEDLLLPQDLDKLKTTIELFVHFGGQAFKTFVLNKEVGES